MGSVEADDRPPRLRPRHAQAGRPERLQDQPLRSRRRGPHQVVEEDFRLDALFLRQQDLAQAELLLEPAHHPVAAIDLDLQAVAARHGGRVGRDQGDDLDVAAVGGVDRGRRAVAQAADVRLQAAGADHLAGFVRRRRDQGQTFRQAGGRRRFRRDVAQHACWRNQIGQDGRVERHGPPLPVPAARPGQALVVEGDVSDLAADGIDESPGQAVGQVAGEQQVFVRGGPDFRLARPDPVGFGFGLQVSHRVRHAYQAEDRAPQPADRRQALRAALIQPDDGRAQRPAVPVEIDQRRALGSQGHAGHRFGADVGSGEQLARGLAERLPEVLRVLLRPAGLRLHVGPDADAGRAQQPSLQVKEQGAHALCAVVNRQDHVTRHRRPPFQKLQIRRAARPSPADDYTTVPSRPARRRKRGSNSRATSPASRSSGRRKL